MLAKDPNEERIVSKSVIKTAASSDEASTIGVLVLAFSADPVAQWMWPDPKRYRLHFPSFVNAFGGKAFAHRSAYFVDDYTAAALWLPPGVLPDEDMLVRIFKRTVPEQIQEDVFTIFDRMGRYHPSEPHWYLPLMGVDPLKQGKGFGSALIEHALVQIDREGKPAYLESSNPRNISLYERYGFELLGTIQTGSSPSVFPMLRRPR